MVAYGIAMPVSRGILTPQFVPSAEAQQFFDRLATQPNLTRKALYDQLIRALVAAGVWSKLDVLLMLAAADQATALTNLKSSSFSATAISSPVFTADLGFAGGSPTYIDTNFNPSTASGNFTQNSASAFGWSNKPGQDLGAIFGCVTSAGAGCGAVVFPRYIEIWPIPLLRRETRNRQRPLRTGPAFGCSRVPPRLATAFTAMVRCSRQKRSYPQRCKIQNSRC